MTDGLIALNFNTVPDLDLDYANRRWSDLLKEVHSEVHDHDGLLRSLVETIRDALNAETDERISKRLAAELDGLTPDDFNE